MACFNKNSQEYKQISERFNRDDARTSFLLNTFLEENPDKELTVRSFNEWYNKYLIEVENINNSIELLNDIEKSKEINFNGATGPVKIKEGVEALFNKKEITQTTYKDLEGNEIKGDVITYPSEVGDIKYIKNNKGDLIMVREEVNNSSNPLLPEDSQNIFEGENNNRNSIYNPINREIDSNLSPDERIQSLKEGMAWLHERMPDVSPEFVQGLINNVADGRYEITEDLISLSKDFATKEVVKEEAFHRAFHALTSYTTREKLLNEASERFGIKRDGTQFIDIILEEEIAKLARTAKDESIKNSAIGKFFQSLINMLRNLFKEKSEIDRYIRNIEQARYEKFPTERRSVELEGEIEGTINERYSLFDVAKFKEKFNNAYKGNLDKVVENIKPGSIDVKVGNYKSVNDIALKNLKRLRTALKSEIKKTEIDAVKKSLKKDIVPITNAIKIFEDLDEVLASGYMILEISNFLNNHIKNIMPDNKNFVREDYVRINAFLNTATHMILELRNSFENSQQYKDLENSNEFDNQPIDPETAYIESKEQYVKNINRIIGEINSTKELLMKRASNYLDNTIVESGGKSILDESGNLKATREFDSVRSNAYTEKMFNVNSITGKMNRIIQQNVAKIKLSHDAFVKKHKSLKDEFKKEFKGKPEEIYKRFIQKDENGNDTTFIIREESPEYIKGLSEAYESKEYKVQSILKFHAEHSDLIFNEDEFEELLQNKLEQNRKYFESIGSDRDFIDEKIKKKENDLRKAYTNFLVKLDNVKKNPTKKYNDDGFSSNYILLRNEDFFSRKKVNGRLIQPISFKPKEEFKNKEYNRLMSLPDNNVEKKMYLHIKETLANYWASVKRPGSFVDFTTVPEMRIEKSTKEQFGNWFENLFFANNERQTKYRDIITGEEKNQIPVYMTGNSLDITERSFDLAKIVESAHLESTSYSIRKDMENDLMLYNEVLKAIKTFKIDIKGNPLKDAAGNILLESMEASNLYKAMKYRIDNLVYDVKNTEDINLHSKYSKEDIQLLQKLHKELSDFSLDQKTKDEIIAAVDNGEFYDTGESKEALTFLNNYREYKKLKETKLRLLSVGKIANSAMSYTTLRYLFANPISAVAEFLQGLSALSLISVSRRHMKEPDIWKSLAEVVKGSPKSENKIRQLSSIFGSVSEEILGTEKKISNKLMKIGFAGYQGANFLINNAILVSHLKNTIIKDLEGNDHRLYDVISVQDGVIELPDNFDQKLLYQSDGVPTEFLTDIMVKFEHILREFRDRRNANDPLMANGNWVLRALLQFKGGWLINQMVLRYGGYEEGNEYSPEKKGFYRVVLGSMMPKIKDPVTGELRRTFNPALVSGAVAKTLVEVYNHSLLGRKLGKDKNSQLEEYEQDAFRMFAREASIILSITAAILIMRIIASNIDDDDDKDGLNLLLNQMIRLDRDLTTYASPNSLLSFFKNPIPTLTTITDLAKFTFMIPTAALNLKLFEDEDFGSKFINRGINLTPLKTVKGIISRTERLYDEM